MEVALWASRARAVASLESGASTRATRSATTRSRSGDASRRQQAVEAELLQGSEHSGDMAVGPRAGDLEQLIGGEQRLAAQGASDQLDDGVGEMGEVAEGLVLDLAVFAVGTSEQVGAVDAPLVAALRSDDMDRPSTSRHTSTLPKLPSVSTYLVTTILTSKSSLLIRKILNKFSELLTTTPPDVVRTSD